MFQKNNRKRVIIKREVNHYSFWNKMLSNSGLIIAAIPTTTYIIYLIISVGQFAYFNVPISLISFNIIEFLFSLSLYLQFTMAFFFISLLITLFIYPFSSGKNIKKSKTQFLLLYILVVILSLLIYICYAVPKDQVLFWFSFCIVLFYLGLISIIIAFNQKKGLVKKVYEGIVGNNKNSERFRINGFFYAYRKVYFFSVFTIFILIEFYFIGILSAMNREYYYLVNVPTPCVGIYVQEDRIICASFDRDKKEVEPIFRILYYSNNADIQMSYERIGPLHLKSTPTPTLKPTLTPTITKTPLPTNTPTKPTQSVLP